MKKKKKSQSVTECTDVVNVEQWTKNMSACVPTKSKSRNTVNYWVWDTVMWMQILKEFKAACELVHF